MASDDAAARTFSRAHALAASKQGVRRREAAARTHEARRTLWKRDVKAWLNGHDCGAEWDMPEKEERMLLNWFNALDTDQSGTIEVSEIREMMASLGLRLTPGQLMMMFATIGKQVHQPLSANDFVRLMHLSGGSVLGDALKSLSSTDLFMMEYRRQRVLSDIRRPERRGAFASRESFLKTYAGRRTKRLATGRRPPEESWGAKEERSSSKPAWGAKEQRGSSKAGWGAKEQRGSSKACRGAKAAEAEELTWVDGERFDPPAAPATGVRARVGDAVDESQAKKSELLEARYSRATSLTELLYGEGQLLSVDPSTASALTKLHAAGSWARRKDANDASPRAPPARRQPLFSAQSLVSVFEVTGEERRTRRTAELLDGDSPPATPPPGGQSRLARLLDGDSLPATPPPGGQSRLARSSVSLPELVPKLSSQASAAK